MTCVRGLRKMDHGCANCYEAEKVEDCLRTQVVQLREERDAMQRRAEAAEHDMEVSFDEGHQKGEDEGYSRGYDNGLADGKKEGE